MRRQSRDIPFIQLVADNSSDAITDALMLGAQDALPQGEDERLVLVANRELAGLAERRARRAAELALREAEKRCQLLLDSSVDAITYVHDGMHIYANRSYMALFGYEDAEELEGLPVIDLIASCDQGAFRFPQGLPERPAPDRTGLHRGQARRPGIQGAHQPLRRHLRRRTLHPGGDPRRGRQRRTGRKLREVSSQDPVTGLYNRSHFLDLMDAAVQQAVTARKPSTLAYIHLNGYPRSRPTTGFPGSTCCSASWPD